ncbi:MAG: MFS transporter [bacterium]|nr:MFS transporter [bacterium]
MNSILTILTTSAFFANSAMALTVPIVAVFIVEDLVGGSVAAAGFAATIYMVVKALLQIPVGRYTDGDSGCMREYGVMLVGRVLLVAVPFLYLFIDHIRELYMLQVLAGIGAALVYPGWMVLFTRFADHQQEGREWSWFNTLVTFGGAAAASFGGWSAQRFGFDVVFITWGILEAISLMTTLFLSQHHTDLATGCATVRRKHIVHNVHCA